MRGNRNIGRYHNFDSLCFKPARDAINTSYHSYRSSKYRHGSRSNASLSRFFGVSRRGRTAYRSACTRFSRRLNCLNLSHLPNYKS